MKYLLLAIIRGYWFLIPKAKRRKCIFKKSCSHHVYEMTEQKGLQEGIKALKFRFENCRPQFELFKNPINDKIQIILPSQIILDSEEIADSFLIN